MTTPPRVLVLVSTAGQDDLLRVCLDSLAWYAPQAEVRVIRNAPGDARNHANGIETTRSGGLPASEIIVLFDDDACVLSHEWLHTLLEEFKDPDLGAWGADTGHGVLHASCLAMRREIFDAVPTFHADWTREHRGARRDTAGPACDWMRAQGYDLIGLRGRHTARGVEYGVPSVWPQPLWVHLGSGTGGPGRWWKRWAYAKRRRRYLEAARAHGAFQHGRWHDARGVEDHR